MLTKATIVTYENVPDQYHEELSMIRDDKIDELYALGKTDGTHVRLSEYQIKRFWLDQQAAEDWKAFMLSASSQFNINMSFVIEDIPT